ncbi:MAG: hypothetical protein PHT69_10240 [Bacteroidales bacterium]|nr:hypothetical protein [Bacteroidales bacterium]
MKKLIRDITLIFGILIFTLCFVGINITKHYCSSCEKTQFFVFFHPKCCHEHDISHHNEDIACCSSSGHNSLPKNHEDNNIQQSSCCEDTNFYLKLDNEYVVNTIPRINEVSVIAIPLLYKIVEINMFFDKKICFQHNLPPPLLFKADSFIIFSKQLLFYD